MIHYKMISTIFFWKMYFPLVCWKKFLNNALSLSVLVFLNSATKIILL